MNLAQNIIHKFGGQTALAKLLKISQGAVYHWSQIGYIPPKWHQEIQRLARERSIPLTASEFVETSSNGNALSLQIKGLDIAVSVGENLSRFSIPADAACTKISIHITPLLDSP